MREAFITENTVVAWSKQVGINCKAQKNGSQLTNQLVGILFWYYQINNQPNFGSKNIWNLQLWHLHHISKQPAAAPR